MRRWMRHRIVAIVLAFVAGTTGYSGDRPARASELGEVEFPTSGSPAAQERFLEGVLLLHSFEYDDAREAFQEARKVEPDFAMAHWGEAMTHNHPLWAQQDADQARAGLAQLAPTPEERLAKAPTERERDYLSTVEVLYGEGTKEERDFVYLDAMRRLAEKYPDDLEAASFYALATLGTSHDERDFRIYMRAAAIVEEVFNKNPNHPGAAHYLVHSYDDPIHAPLGLRAARVYAKIAPAAAHALHMPTHIFLSMGMWDDVVASNEDSWEAADARVKRKNLGVDDRSYHALWWLEYGYLQQGRYRDARRLLSIMEEDTRKSGSPKTRRHLVMLRAHYRIETQKWSADSIKVDTSGLRTSAVASDLFVHGLSAVKTGDVRSAKSALVDLETFLDSKRKKARQSSAEAGGSYSTVSLSSIRGAEVMAKELQALINLAEEMEVKAVETMRAAVNEEDALALAYGPPYPVKPAHELFGEILLELGRPEEAQEQFKRALDRAPKRRLSLLGLARTATKSGDQLTAADAYAELRRILHRADEDLLELSEFKAANSPESR